MKIVILGGTGFVGSALAQALQQDGYQVAAYGRDIFQHPQQLSQAIENLDLLIHMSGANIGQRWSKSYKQEIWSSRIDTTAQLQQVLDQCTHPPKRILATSAIGIYPQNSCDAPVDETCQASDASFLGQLGKAWEQANLKLSPTPTLLRFGVVLGHQGGALQKMLPAFKMGLGGPVAGGQQCFSWVHISDLIQAYRFLIKHPQEQGIFNITSPYPVSQRTFGQQLAKQLHRPFWLPLPAWQLKLMFGEGAQVLTHSSAVLPNKLLQAGFKYEFARLEDALADIVKKL